MEETLRSTGICYNWFEKCREHHILLSFKGLFNQSLVNALLWQTEERSLRKNHPAGIRNKVFGILVESLQNIVKHGQSDENHPGEKPGILIISKYRHEMIVSTGNLIRKSEAEMLHRRLSEYIHASKEELTTMEKQILKKAHLSPTSGAGLGLIQIIKRSDHFDFHLREINDEYSFFDIESRVHAGVC